MINWNVIVGKELTRGIGKGVGTAGPSGKHSLPVAEESQANLEKQSQCDYSTTNKKWILWGRPVMAPKDMSLSPCHRTVNFTLFGQRVLANVIKLSFSKWGDYPGLSCWGLNAITGFFVRERQRAIRHATCTEEKAMWRHRQRRGWCGHCVLGCWQPSETR